MGLLVAIFFHFPQVPPFLQDTRKSFGCYQEAGMTFFLCEESLQKTFVTLPPGRHSWGIQPPSSRSIRPWF